MNDAAHDLVLRMRLRKLSLALLEGFHKLVLLVIETD